MLRKFAFAGVCGALALVVLAALGCGGEKAEQAAAEKMMESAIEQSAKEDGKDVDVDIDQSGESMTMTVKGEDGNYTMSSGGKTELPEGLPAGVRLPLLGDLVICAPVVAREAREQRKPLAAHYAHLTVHGALHLLGWDHEDPREADCMEQLEREILAGLGLPDPYQPA